MRRQRSLSAARDRDHPAREGADRERSACHRRKRKRRAAATRCSIDDEITAVKESGDAMADHSRLRLGRGLAALMGDVGTEPKTMEGARNQRRVPIEYLKPSPRNPRRNFS